MVAGVEAKTEGWWRRQRTEITVHLIQYGSMVMVAVGYCWQGGKRVNSPCIIRPCLSPLSASSCGCSLKHLSMSSNRLAAHRCTSAPGCPESPSTKHRSANCVNQRRAELGPTHRQMHACSETSLRYKAAKCAAATVLSNLLLLQTTANFRYSSRRAALTWSLEASGHLFSAPPLLQSQTVSPQSRPLLNFTTQLRPLEHFSL